MTAALNLSMMTTTALERGVVQYIFSLREWTPRTARAWVLARGLTIHSVQSNDYECIIHLRPMSDYVVRSLQRTYLKDHEGVSAADATLRGSLVGPRP